MAKILVVDDESDLRFILRRLLERAGHQVAEAGDGVEALQRVKESHPDLVITDVMMPVMDGAELIRRLRAEPATAGVPVIVVTAFGGGQEIDANVARVIKPFKLSPLLAEVNNVLAREAK